MRVLNVLIVFSVLFFNEYPGEVILLPAFIGYNETTLNMYLIATDCGERARQPWLCVAS